ncbi:MAG: hypothetical protein R3E92_21245 [Burkholderiaceae bacterium]
MLTSDRPPRKKPTSTLAKRDQTPRHTLGYDRAGQHENGIASNELVHAGGDRDHDRVQRYVDPPGADQGRQAMA